MRIKVRLHDDSVLEVAASHIVSEGAMVAFLRDEQILHRADVSQIRRIDLLPEPSPGESVPAASLDELRSRHPNAYRRWTAEEDKQLLAAYAEQIPVMHIALALGRQPGAIRSRLRIMLPELRDRGHASDPNSEPGRTRRRRARLR